MTCFKNVLGERAGFAGRVGFSILILTALVLSGLNRSGMEASFAAENREGPGLLLLTHGSPSPTWSGKVDQLVEKIRKINEEQGVFVAVEAAHLEFCQPDAAAGIEKLEAAGCNRILVVPAFIFPSSHTHFDVPAVLGIYTSPAARKTLTLENARIASPHVPITMTQTLYEGSLLDQYVLDETKALSTQPETEVLLLIAHGDEDHFGLIEPEMRKLVTRTCAATGVSEGDWAYCEVGQSWHENVAPRLAAYAEEGKTVLVVGLYLASPADRIRLAGEKMVPGMAEGQDSPSGESTARFSSNALIDHEALPLFIYETGVEALPRNK